MVSGRDVTAFWEKVPQLPATFRVLLSESIASRIWLPVSFGRPSTTPWTPSFSAVWTNWVNSTAVGGISMMLTSSIPNVSIIGWAKVLSAPDWPLWGTNTSNFLTPTLSRAGMSASRVPDPPMVNSKDTGEFHALGRVTWAPTWESPAASKSWYASDSTEVKVDASPATMLASSVALRAQASSVGPSPLESQTVRSRHPPLMPPRALKAATAALVPSA